MEQKSEEWYEARKGRVTASLVGAILGLSPYMSRADAMRVMVREALGAEREFKGNVATDYGTRNEPGALIDYRLETQNDVQAVGFVPFEDWLGASPDGLIGDEGGLEIKCPYGLRDAEKPVPFKSLAEQPHYYAQVQASLFVTGREWWDFFQWAPKGTALERAFPDQAWRDDNIPRLRQFHAEFLHELEHNAEEHLAPKRIEIDTPEAHRMMAEWDEINEQLERAAERKKDLLADMVRLSGERDALFAGRKLTMVSRQGAISYAKVVKEHLPKLDLEPYRGKATNYWQVA